MSPTGHWRSEVRRGQRRATSAPIPILVMLITMSDRAKKSNLGRGSRRKHLSKHLRILRESFLQGSRNIMLSAVGTRDDSERSP
jgi:hypothetical protein